MYGPIRRPSIVFVLRARLPFGRRNAQKRQRVGVESCNKDSPAPIPILIGSPFATLPSRHGHFSSPLRHLKSIPMRALKSRSHGDLLPWLRNPGRPYQTRQEFTGYMGWPLVQPKALPNSSKFCTAPFARHSPGEWGSVSADCRADCSVWFWHQTWAKPRK